MFRLLLVTFFLVSLVACAPAGEQASPNTGSAEDSSNDESGGDTSVSSEDEGLETTGPKYQPQAEDKDLQRGNAMIDVANSDLLTLETYPLRFNLVLRGSLPTPCHQLRAVVNAPDAENKINIEAYSVVDPETVCAQVIEPFETTVGLGSFPAGHYTVLVNGEQVAEFDAE